MATKKKHAGAKRYFRTRMTYSHSLMVLVDVSKIDYSSSILLDLGVKIMKSVIAACFRHNSCCLPNVRSLAGSETVPQCIGHASFLTLIFHKVVQQRV